MLTRTRLRNRQDEAHDDTCDDLAPLDNDGSRYPLRYGGTDVGSEHNQETPIAYRRLELVTFRFEPVKGRDS